MEKSTIARALELARDGTCHRIGEIRRKLHAEDYSDVDQTLGGASIQSQLRSLMKAAKAPVQTQAPE